MVIANFSEDKRSGQRELLRSRWPKGYEDNKMKKDKKMELATLRLLY
jgi:hypothetical protein